MLVPFQIRHKCSGQPKVRDVPTGSPASSRVLRVLVDAEIEALTHG